jgi:hypothetical protein
MSGSTLFMVAAVAASLATYCAALETVDDDEFSVGLVRRLPWTSSNFHGRPKPRPPYCAKLLYSRIQFEKTKLLVVAPGGRLFVGEYTGKI